MDDKHYRILALKTLLPVILDHRAYLEAMNKNAFTPGIAWTARNILELAVWTKYCACSEQNAKIFFEDCARDSISMMDIPDELIKPSGRESFNQVRKQLQTNAAEDEIARPDAYMRVANAAKKVNFPLFGKFNMILSKWAHPTAINVFSHRQVPPQLNQLFYTFGSEWANASIEAIRVLWINSPHEQCSAIFRV